MAPRSASAGKGSDSRAHKAAAMVSAKEVKEKNYLVIGGKCYDAPRFVSQHPGGDILMTYAGRDASDVFAAFHRGSADSFAKLEGLYVGDLASPLENTVAESGFEKDIRSLGAKLQAQGLFKADPVWYLLKTTSTAALGLCGALLCLWPGSNFAMKIAAAFFIALFWQQCGWTSHDYAHHAVFKNRRLNDVAVLFFGGLFQGFSLSWWRSKHNRHHSVPNQHETGFEAHDGDPDIDTLPFLAWSRQIAKKAKQTLLGGSSQTDKKTDAAAPASSSLSSTLFRTTLSNQSWLYFPLLCFARFSWALQSLFFVFEKEVRVSSTASGWSKGERYLPIQYVMAERVGLSLHWILYFALMAYTMDVTEAVSFFLVSQMLAGFFLALAFGVGHNGMEIFDETSRPGFFEMQVRSTRDVKDEWLNGWFCGGLHYQVTHHLFPTLPRHNLRLVTPMVKEIASKHGVPYKVTGLWEGTMEVLDHLAEVATEIHQGPQ